MHPLPLEPFVAFLFRLLPGVVYAHRHPRMFLQDRRFNQERVHDREKAGSLEIIPLEFGVVWKQKVDIRMNIGSPSSGSHPGIDFASGEEIELGSSLRNTLYLEPVRRLPCA